RVPVGRRSSKDRAQNQSDHALASFWSGPSRTEHNNPLRRGRFLLSPWYEDQARRELYRHQTETHAELRSILFGTAHSAGNPTIETRNVSARTPD
ncbi:hypothetical protein ACJ73_08808, partial [Blastomyces percursus]